eukprot:CAMPEP_0179210362 /NCGR_PEP_ID=MMETSP0796-20121207/104918_1 /TAXON_ID=73915 /ORGANISM="Pyrodinium bahamense, Strain pbaha01" /LENGTH=206 /DNA_ID=CAMNT_0020915325 /DNA_START=195 /DNA_END=814 /DNA_ORIENTATION=+
MPKPRRQLRRSGTLSIAAAAHAASQASPGGSPDPAAQEKGCGRDSLNDAKELTDRITDQATAANESEGISIPTANKAPPAISCALRSPTQQLRVVDTADLPASSVAPAASRAASLGLVLSLLAAARRGQPPPLQLQRAAASCSWATAAKSEAQSDEGGLERSHVWCMASKKRFQTAVKRLSGDQASKHGLEGKIQNDLDQEKEDER